MGIESKDFCRYSPYFVVRRGERRLPEFGLALATTSEAELATLSRVLDLPAGSVGASLRIWLFREQGDQVALYYGEPPVRQATSTETVAAIEELLPLALVLDP